jgi:hypothetical protein
MFVCLSVCFNVSFTKTLNRYRLNLVLGSILNATGSNLILAVIGPYL